MAVTVAGNWELSWNTPIAEGHLWNLPLRAFEVEEWKMTPVTGIKNTDAGTKYATNLTEYHTFEEMLADCAGTRIFVEPPNKFNRIEMTLLQDFVHPEDAVYIFGSAHLNPTQLYAKEGDLGLTVPTTRGSGVCWPHQIMVAIMYDRLVKSCQS